MISQYDQSVNMISQFSVLCCLPAPDRKVSVTIWNPSEENSFRLKSIEVMFLKLGKREGEAKREGKV